MNPNLISLIPTAASLGCHVVTFYTFNTTKLKRFSREGPPVLPASSLLIFFFAATTFPFAIRQDWR